MTAPTPMTLDEFHALSDEEFAKLLKAAKGQRGFHRKYGIARTTVQNRMYRARKDPFGHRPPPQPIAVGDNREIVERFILTSAQDSTVLHEPFLDNLIAYRDWLRKSGSCELMIAGFTYNKSLFEDHSKSGVAWPARIAEFMVSDRYTIAGRVDFCGEMNTLPTAVDPLSGFESYTQSRWGVFPHAKVQLKSIPTMKHAPSKQIMTTGAVTLPNYVPKKAGLKASFHHEFGAVLVEVDRDGDFFCRHLLGDPVDGSFCDLDRLIVEGEIHEGQRIRALTPGDVHVFQIDPQVAATTFGIYPTGERDANPRIGRIWDVADKPSMLDDLRPEHLLIHDVADFRVRNHHNISNALDRFRLFIAGTDSVEDELREVGFFLSTLDDLFADMEVTVVESNHDLAFQKWLTTADYRNDPVNARFFLRSILRIYDAADAGLSDFSIFEETMRNHYADFSCAGVRFLREDESFVIDDVEMANHGHNGANGSRGNIRQFAKAGPKTTFGHTHSPAIFDGAYNTGTSTLMDMGYNKGLSSWAHSHCAQYLNGKRTLITLQNGKYRA